jgi:aspartyl-tRNA(Asn)/glutamyl-tRNA(Gln) amidotransferase subunit A
VAYGSSLDQVGPLATTARDLEKLMSVMVGGDSRDMTSVQDGRAGWNSRMSGRADLSLPQSRNGSVMTPEAWSQEAADLIKRQKFVFLSDSDLEGVSDEVLTVYQDMRRFLASQGATVEERAFSKLKYSISVYYIIATSEASSNLSRFDGVRFGQRPAEAREAGKLDAFYEATRTLFGFEVKKRILMGTAALSTGYYDEYYKKAAQVRRVIRDEFSEGLGGDAVLVLPLAATPAFKQGSRPDSLQMYRTDLYTVLANITGFPAAVFNAGASSEGLPIGLQLMGLPFSDERICSILTAIEDLRTGAAHE